MLGQKEKVPVRCMSEIKGCYGARVSVPYNSFEIRDFLKRFDVWNSPGAYAPRSYATSETLDLVWFEFPFDSMNDGMTSKFLHSDLFRDAIKRMGGDVIYVN